MGYETSCDFGKVAKFGFALRRGRGGKGATGGQRGEAKGEGAEGGRESRGQGRGGGEGRGEKGKGLGNGGGGAKRGGGGVKGNVLNSS